MKSNIKALEDRVARVVDRLKSATEERDRLRDELAALREQLASLEREGRVPGSGWSARLGELEVTLREAVRELRGP
jgi:chromosome segregation ATPase